jgi:hypothetical protein
MPKIIVTCHYTIATCHYTITGGVLEVSKASSICLKQIADPRKKLLQETQGKP